MHNRFDYLIHLQFLGFRYHGWQKQKDVKTLHLMLERTFKFIFKDKRFKILGASRTDAMVSANHFLSALFTYEKINTEELVELLNKNLPADMRVLKITDAPKDFNVIQDITSKEYHYYFSFGERPHPFSAPFMAHIHGDLEIDEMIKAAPIFNGRHWFKNYCHRASADKDYYRDIISCEIAKNDLFTGEIFPKNSYVLKVKGKGFVHHQIRIMMGTLIRLGKKEIDPQRIEQSLKEGEDLFIGKIAPASGLHLHKTNI